MIGGGLLTILIIIVVLWLIIQLRWINHKFAFTLVITAFLFYLSFFLTLKGKDIDYTSFSGILYAGKIYFAWMNTVLDNLKSITAYVIKLNWKV